MISYINLAGLRYSVEWHEGMQSFLVNKPNGTWAKVGGTLDVALINMWDYIKIPSCFSGDVEGAKSIVNGNVRRDFANF